MDFSVMGTALARQLILLLAGYVLFRVHILDEHTNRGISSLIVNVTSPALILSSLASTGGMEKGTVVRIILFGVLFYALLPLLAALITRVMRIEKYRRGTIEDLIIFCNNGFMAVAVLQPMYGDIAVFILNIMNLPFNFLIYTYGIYQLQKDAREKEKLSRKEDGALAAAQTCGQTPTHTLSWKTFLSPGLIAAFITLILFLTGLRLPTFLSETCSYLGGITPPLAMVLIGSILGEYPLKESFADGRLNATMIVKLLFLPLVAFFLALLFFPDDPMLITITTLTYGMPCGTMTVMFSKMYHGDSQSAAAGTVFSTLLSMLTLPLLFFLLSRVL